MLRLGDLKAPKVLTSEDMAKITGGWWIFGWGGVIGNPRRQPDQRDHKVRYNDGVRTRDYRDGPAPEWPTVD